MRATHGDPQVEGQLDNSDFCFVSFSFLNDERFLRGGGHVDQALEPRSLGLPRTA